MGKVTSIREHDWLAVRATFANGVKANVTWSRGGERVTVIPEDSKLAEALSLVVAQSKARTTEAAYPFRHLGDIADEMVKVAKDTATLADYVARLRTNLAVSGERPKPAVDGPAEAIVEIRKSRGWIVTATFPSGERMELKINTASVGLALHPNIASRFDEVLKAVFGIKHSGVLADEALATRAADLARGTPDLDAWLAEFKAAFAPGGPVR